MKIKLKTKKEIETMYRSETQTDPSDRPLAFTVYSDWIADQMFGKTFEVVNASTLKVKCDFGISIPRSFDVQFEGLPWSISFRLVKAVIL